MPCNVLKCQDPPSEQFIYSEEPQKEAVLCERHHRLIQDGAEWRFDLDSGRIIMGDDLLGTHMYVVSPRPMSVEWSVADPPGTRRLNLEVRRLGSDTSERLTLALSDEAAAALKDMIEGP